MKTVSLPKPDKRRYGWTLGIVVGAIIVLIALGYHFGFIGKRINSNWHLANVAADTEVAADSVRINYQLYEADRMRELPRFVVPLNDHYGLLSNMNTTDTLDLDEPYQFVTSLSANGPVNPILIAQNDMWQVLKGPFKVQGYDVLLVTKDTGDKYEAKKCWALAMWFRAATPEDRQRQLEAAEENRDVGQLRPIAQGFSRELSLGVAKCKFEKLPGNKYRFYVPANVPLNDTGLNLNAGDRIKVVSYAGMVNGSTVPGDGANCWVQANGWNSAPEYPNFLNRTGCYRPLLVPGPRNFMGLVMHYQDLSNGWITSVWPTDQRITKKCRFLLGVNEPWLEGDQLWSDNAGTIVVTIEIQRA